MHVFLQGPSGAGKSRLLWEALAPYALSLGGFTAQRIIKNGGRAGFRAAFIQGVFPPPVVEFREDLPDIFILKGLYNLSALEEIILRVEKQAKSSRCKVILLDEIGGVELSSRIFMDALYRIVSMGIPCAGVLKSRENLARASSVLGLGSEYAALHGELEELILCRGRLITLDEQNYGQTLGYIRKKLIPFLENRP
jgi:nucleoside-triphosphatase THEP1